jgi:hypothetical protein
MTSRLPFRDGAIKESTIIYPKCGRAHRLALISISIIEVLILSSTRLTHFCGRSQWL